MYFIRIFHLMLHIQLLAIGHGFYNPIVPKGQDPSVTFHQGSYYLVQSDTNRIVVYRSEKLEDLGKPEKNITVWRSTNINNGSLCCNVRAPEFFYYSEKDRYYIYFAFGDDYSGYITSALISAGNDPMGPYILQAEELIPRRAVDPTVLQLKGKNYYVWSGWPNPNDDNTQAIYIAIMINPITVIGDGFAISLPTQPWEIKDGNHAVNEGPTPLYHNDKTYIAFSACERFTDCYCLGLLTYIGGNPLYPSSWSKSNGCVFQSNSSESVYGPGSNSFTISPDGTETWIVYHADAQSNASQDGLSIRAQRVDWNSDGSPNFGTPVGFETSVNSPSTSGGSLAYVNLYLISSIAMLCTIVI